jgi:hypothetical protein
MDFEGEQKIRNELRPKEQLLWCGQPYAGILFRWFDVPISIFGLIWTGGVVTGMVEGFQKGPPIALLFFIPFILVGAFFLFGRFLFDAWLRSKTYYAISDQRAFILAGVFSQTVRSFHLDTLSEITVTERRNGYGRIILGAVSPWEQWQAPSGMGPNPFAPSSFECVEGVRKIYEILSDARQHAKQK